MPIADVVSPESPPGPARTQAWGGDAFRLSIAPACLRTVAGSTFYLTAALLRAPGFDEPIEVAIDSARGIQTAPLPAPADRPTFRVHIDSASGTERRILTVRAVAGSRIREVPFHLDLQDLVVRLAEPDALLAAGGSATLAVRILRAPSLEGPVGFSLQGLAPNSGLEASFLPAATLGDSTYLRLVAAPSAPAADHSLIVSARCGEVLATSPFRVEVLGPG